MTKIVINKMKAEFENRQVYVDVFNIENCPAHDISYSQYDALGIAYPVHSFNAPEIVVQFVCRLPRVDRMKTFIISTAGGVSSLNNASSELLIKILAKKGYAVFYNRQFVMPSNFIIKDNAVIVKEKITRAINDVPKTVSDIINCVPCNMTIKMPAKVIAFFGRAEWIGVKCARFFYADAAKCNLCGICVNKCPNHNINMIENHIVFKRKRGLCMRCLYICPKRAIKTRRLFRFIGFDSWYEDDGLSIDE